MSKKKKKKTIDLNETQSQLLTARWVAWRQREEELREAYQALNELVLVIGGEGAVLSMHGGSPEVTLP